MRTSHQARFLTIEGTVASCCLADDSVLKTLHSTARKKKPPKEYLFSFSLSLFQQNSFLSGYFTPLISFFHFSSFQLYGSFTDLWFVLDITFLHVNFVLKKEKKQRNYSCSTSVPLPCLLPSNPGEIGMSKFLCWVKACVSLLMQIST